MNELDIYKLFSFNWMKFHIYHICLYIYISVSLYILIYSIYISNSYIRWVTLARLVAAMSLAILPSLQPRHTLYTLCDGLVFALGSALEFRIPFGSFHEAAKKMTIVCFILSLLFFLAVLPKYSVATYAN